VGNRWPWRLFQSTRDDADVEEADMKTPSTRPGARRPAAGWRLSRVAGFLAVFAGIQVGVLPVFADESCRPNVFGGEDCRASDGRSISTSRPNVFGGRDTTFSDGTRATSRPNVFGGEDITGPHGRVDSRPNVFGGQDYRLPDGKQVTSRPNVFGGRDYRGPDGKTVACRPNVFGGQDCR